MTSALTLAVCGLATRPHAQGVPSGYPWCSPRPGLSRFRRWTAHSLAGDDTRQASRSTRHGVQVPTPSEGCGGRTVPSAHVRCRTWSVGSGESHRAHSTNHKRSHCGRIVSNQPLLIGTVDAVPHKRVHGGGARLRMLLPVARNDRAMCPGYAAVEYVKVRPRCRRPHPSPALRS